MGYVFVLGQCVACKKTFSFHPHKVPSLPVNGNREPVCRDCIEKANPIRIEQGLPPLTYASDAYEACPESEF